MYLKVKEDGLIVDCIDYHSNGYVEYRAEILEIVHGGWYKLINGEIIEQVDLNPNNIETAKQTAIDDYTMDLIIGGVI